MFDNQKDTVIPNFDEHIPPKMFREGNDLVLVFNILPPFEKEKNPIFSRLEVVLGNRTGHRKISKEKNGLKYRFIGYDEKIIPLVYNTISKFYDDPSMTKFDGMDSFLKAPITSEFIKIELKKKLGNFKYRIYKGNKMVLYIDEIELHITWHFLRGDIGSEYQYTVNFISKALTDEFNSNMIIFSGRKMKAASLLLGLQGSGVLKSLPRNFDVQTKNEVVNSVEVFVKCLLEEVFPLTKNKFTIESFYSYYKEDMKNPQFTILRNVINLLFLEKVLFPQQLNKTIDDMLNQNKIPRKHVVERVKEFKELQIKNS